MNLFAGVLCGVVALMNGIAYAFKPNPMLVLFALGNAALSIVNFTIYFGL